MIADPLLDAATSRVNQTPRLREYRDLLLDYEWGNRDDHLRWVAGADENEIVHWAETIRRDEQGEEGQQ